MRTSCFVAITLVQLLGTLDNTAAAADRPDAKPRVIVTTDINAGPGDPDDRQSLCHLLWYANQLDIRAIIPDRFSETAIAACHMAFDLYEQDFNSAKTNFKQLRYPQAAFFRNDALVTHRREAIRRIIEEAERDDARPLWLLVWGNMKLLADALNAKPEIADKLRIITIGTNVKAKESGGDGHERNWNGHGRQSVYDNFPMLWWVESDWTYNGMFPGREPIRLKEDLKRCGGQLGGHINDVIGAVPWADNFRAGDTPSVLYLIDPDHDLDDPTQSSWAGRYERPFPDHRPYYWTGIAGGYTWNYAEPSQTWDNASGVYRARVSTLFEQRAEMYAALLKRVQSLYGTEGLEQEERELDRLQEFTPSTGLVIDAKDSERKGDTNVVYDSAARSGSYVDVRNRASIVWRFNYDGQPDEFPAVIRFRLQSDDTRQELFVNSANLGDVPFSGEKNAWRIYRFKVHLEKGPNSVVIRMRSGHIQYDALGLGLSDMTPSSSAASESRVDSERLPCAGHETP